MVASGWDLWCATEACFWVCNFLLHVQPQTSGQIPYPGMWLCACTRVLSRWRGLYLFCLSQSVGYEGGTFSFFTFFCGWLHWHFWGFFKHAKIPLDSQKMKLNNRYPFLNQHHLIGQSGSGQILHRMYNEKALVISASTFKRSRKILVINKARWSKWFFQIVKLNCDEDPMSIHKQIRISRNKMGSPKGFHCKEIIFGWPMC